jgi:hypothetical protein
MIIWNWTCFLQQLHIVKIRSQLAIITTDLSDNILAEFSLLNNFLSRRLLAKSRLSFYMSFADNIQRIAHPGHASFQ